MRVIRFWVVGLLLTGVVLVSSGFGVVSGSQTSAKPGGVCRVEGKNKFVNGISLVCKEMVSGRLVWRVVKTSAVTPVLTTNTTAVSLVGAVTVVPSVVSASSESGNAVFMIADMSPDTGVYAVQWVPQGSDFNSYQMMRATSKTITVPYLSCTRTYTLRVFVMQENWQMTDGFVNQNVTAHSPTFDLTMPACRDAATTSTVAALTCATGGTCAIGDTGPGGGVVFILASTTGNTTGRTFEAARNDWDGGIRDGTAKWCNAGGEVPLSSLGTFGEAIGAGSTNSSTLSTACASTGNDDAAQYLRGKTIGGRSDWFLPSKNEGLEMFNQRSVFVGNYSFNNTSIDTMRYLLSNEGTDNPSGTRVYYGTIIRFNNGSTDFVGQIYLFSVRPVRSFVENNG